MTRPRLYFYPRSPCGERLIGIINNVVNRIFLSTLSLRRATLRHSADCNCHSISIHALLAESDAEISPNLINGIHFYPRSPCGERPVPRGRHLIDTNFYPRSPCGERRHNPGRGRISQGFLSTLSLRRATVSIERCSLKKFKFLSTLSLRRATHLKGLWLWRK